MIKNKYCHLIIIALFFTIGQINVFCLRGYAEQIDQGNEVNWEKWRNNISGYLNKCVNAVEESQAVINKYVKQLDEINTLTISLLEKTKKIQAITPEAYNAIVQIKNKFLSLKPPLDFDNYHKILIKALETQLLFIDTASKGGDSYKIATQFTLVIIEATKEMKQILIKHGAPQDYIDDQDALIRKLSDR